jgi:hypothetical protein
VYLAALIGAEAFVRRAGALSGATWYALGFVVLVNVTVLAYRRFDGEGVRWRLAAVAAVPFLDRLLVLSVPPFEWGAFEVSALWGLPLLSAAGRPPLVPARAAGSAGHRRLHSGSRDARRRGSWPQVRRALCLASSQQRHCLRRRCRPEGP